MAVSLRPSVYFSLSFSPSLIHTHTHNHMHHVLQPSYNTVYTSATHSLCPLKGPLDLSVGLGEKELAKTGPLKMASPLSGIVVNRNCIIKQGGSINGICPLIMCTYTVFVEKINKKCRPMMAGYLFQSHTCVSLHCQ